MKFNSIYFDVVYFAEKMEGNGKSLERVVSLKALQLGNSFSCKICVIGFLCGVCLTSLFLAALTSFASFQFSPNSTSTSYFISKFTFFSLPLNNFI
ncbi:hypothetical protein HanLR1_Chr14g0547351 [Helianthus annuus]|nr:hypothetical protein HanLR1_Chr14g0547351 [Helianthus annuus]